MDQIGGWNRPLYHPLILNGTLTSTKAGRPHMLKAGAISPWPLTNGDLSVSARYLRVETLRQLARQPVPLLDQVHDADFLPVKYL